MNTPLLNAAMESVPLFHSLGNGTVEHQPETLMGKGFDAFHLVEQKLDQVEHLEQWNKDWNESGTLSLKALANKVLMRNEQWNEGGAVRKSPMSTVLNTTRGINEKKNNIKNILKDVPTPTDKTDIGWDVSNEERGSILPNQVKADPSPSLSPKRITLNDLSSEEITHYRLILEASYRNSAHDAWHGDRMPQRFREGKHTFEEIEAALERFIQRLQTEGSPEPKDSASKLTCSGVPLERTSLVPSESSPAIEALEVDDIKRKAKTAIERFIEAQKALPEYQDYEHKQKLLAKNPKDVQLNGLRRAGEEACTLAWNAFLKACDSLPEWKPFLEAKEWQYLSGIREDERLLPCRRERLPEDKSLKLSASKLTQPIAPLEQDQRECQGPSLPETHPKNRSS